MTHITAKFGKAIIFYILLALFFAPPILATKDETDSELFIELKLENLGSEEYEDVEQSVYFFKFMGEKSIPHLIGNLEVDDKRTKINTIYALGRFGEMAKPAIASIIPFTRDEDSVLRAVAAIALGKIVQDNNLIAIAALEKLMDDKDPWVQQSAIKSLRMIGTEDAVRNLEEVKGNS